MRGKILVVDDEEEIRDLLKELLTEKGFAVTVAENKAGCRNIMKHFHPDCIILDIMLGPENGTDVYEDLLAEKVISLQVPILFLTALAADGPPDRPRKGRHYAIMGKPFSYQKLVHDLDQLIQNYKSKTAT